MLRLDQRLDGIEARIAELRCWLWREWMDLSDWTFDGAPLALGSAWPARDGVRRLEHPSVAPGGERRLVLDLGGEGLLRVVYAGGGRDAFGLDAEHREFGLRPEPFSLEVEIVARLRFGEPNREPRLAVARVVDVEGELERLVRLLQLVVEAARELASAGAGSLAPVGPLGAAADGVAGASGAGAHGAAASLGSTGPGAADLAASLAVAAARALTVLDWPSATWPYLSRVAGTDQMRNVWELPAGLDPHPPSLDEAARRSVAAAYAALRADLDALAERHPPAGALLLTGHAHLDLAWRWPLEETRRKARHTLSTAVGLLDRHPELHFNQSTAQVYAFLEEDDPELLERIAGHVAGGRFEPIGGMWVEPDCVMPAGESLVRQLLYGQRYFRERFGTEHTVCWLPDCFGFTPALPQLLVGAGIRRFLTIKLSWSETNRFPHDLFSWEGLDGSRVLAHMFDNPDGGYNGVVGPRAALRTWGAFRGRGIHPESVLSVGYGDGGGGPTEDMVQRAGELRGFPALPEQRFGRVDEFFDRAEAAAGAGGSGPSGAASPGGAASGDAAPSGAVTPGGATPGGTTPSGAATPGGATPGGAAPAPAVPVWSGELYLELHRGTLTSQGATKRLHRGAERDLVAAEAVSSLCALAGGSEPRSLEPLWRVLLRNQFHDILPGSSIREVYETAEAELRSVIDGAGEAISAGIEELAGRVGGEGVLVVNPDLSPRPVRVELDDGPLTAARSIGGLEAAAIVPGAAAGPVSASARVLENELVRVELGEDGTLAGVLDKRAGREVLADRGNQLWAYVDKPREWDAWDVEATYPEDGRELVATEDVRVVESGPHRVAVRVVRAFRDSRIVQDVRLWAGSARIDFHTRIEWHDRRWLVKARFPLAVRSHRATFETAFGVVERATHRNTSWDAARFEVPGHRFADLSEPGYGAALLNDGRYGHHALGSELGLSLLRSPIWPDPLADEGEQELTYALYPHAGGWLEGGVLAEAEDLNRPLLAVRMGGSAAAEGSPAAGPPPAGQAAYGEPSLRPLRLGGLPLGLGALKPLEDGEGLLLRVYEPQGARGPVSLELPPGWEADSELDLLERPAGEPRTDFAPFQVRTWRLRRLRDS